MPEVQPQTAPTSGKKFPCEQCGAALEFKPGAADLHCPYCGHNQHIPQSAEEVKELDFETYFAKAKVAPQVLEQASQEVACQACGARVMMSSTIATEDCPFCGVHLESAVHSTEPMMEPGSVLPFAIQRGAAKDGFLKWVKSLWFAPNDLGKLAELGRIDGMYVPYWTYDSMTYSYYRGERGEHYWETVGSGKNQRRVRRTRWWPASGRVDHWFDDVLVCSSQGLPQDLAAKLEPWDLPQLVPFQPEYLSGFRTERYQIDARQGFDAARRAMDDTIRSLIRSDIGGDEQRIHSVDTTHTGVTFKHILLPVWIAAYRYQDMTYRVLVNARTGEIQGHRPWSWIKITLAVLLGLILILAIIFMAENGKRGSRSSGRASSPTSLPLAE